MRKMEISVVIPLYNKEPYILRAINSVISQESPPSEIIVVDDGSTDNGGEVIRSLNELWVRYIPQVNAGECAARNRGITEARYPLIAFLDADDEWKPDFLSRIYKLAALFPEAGAFATSAEIIRSDHSHGYPSLGNLPAEPWVGLIPDFFELFQYGYPFNASSIAIPKRILEEVGGFPPGVKVSGDVACWVKIALRYPIAFDTARAVIYHQDAQNRVGHRFPITQQMPYIDIIDEAIQIGLMPDHLQQSALDFAAQKQIMVAAQNVMAGKPAQARKLLATCQDNHKYRQDCLKWRFWASFPPGLPGKMLEIKTLFRKKRK